MRGKQSLYKCLPFVLAAMALVVTGCPHNQYLVQLKPQGDGIERTLVFYREDGVNTNTGAPNYQPFEAGELAAVTALYPAPVRPTPADVTLSGVCSPMNCRAISAARALIPT